MRRDDHAADEPVPAAISMNPEPAITRRVSRAMHVQRVLFAAAVALVASVSVGWYASRAANHREASGAPGKPQSIAEFKLPPLGWEPARPLTATSPPPPPPSAEPASADADGGNAPVAHRAELAAAPAALAPAWPAPQRPNERADDDSPVLWRAHDESAATGQRPAPARAPETGLLTPGYAPARATQMPAGTTTLIKGTAVGCTLETAIESQLAGLVSCLIGTAIYGADGKLVLLPRGTRLLGEARSEPRSGQSRIYVLWIEARTPQGVLVPLASPATDALGRAGVPGRVDTHFFERFGAALLISVVDAGVQAATSRRGGGTVVVTPQSSEAILTEVLRNTIAIPPTISVSPGAHLTVLVARDVDFGDVLRADDSPPVARRE